VNRPKAETMKHLEITESTLTAKPALDTLWLMIMGVL
jgi:hypothetical protein